jgi:hypothetical protein
MDKTHLPSPGRLGDQIIFVIATAAQSGKSTASRRLAERTGAEIGMTSAVISERLEQRLGLPNGSVSAARRRDPERYRAEIVTEGDAMRAEGRSPGEVCVDRGYRIVDGIRVASEIAAAISAARERGIVPTVVCIERPGVHPVDNTEPTALRAMADRRIDNDAGVEALYMQIDRLADALSAPRS